MRAVIVYESMYGNTRAIADAIGEGLRAAGDVRVVPVAEAGPGLLGQADLVVVGGPTHAHSMSRPATRTAAMEASRKAGSQLRLDPAASGPGVRDWLGAMGQVDAACAAFDTRIAGPAVLTGRASKGIASLLQRHGLTALASPESFLVTKANELYPGQAERAREWGALLAQRLLAEGSPARVRRAEPA